MSKKKTLKNISWIDRYLIWSGWALLAIPFLFAELIARISYPLILFWQWLEIRCLSWDLHQRSKVDSERKIRKEGRKKQS